jgi:biotin synthase-like enzyme
MGESLAQRLELAFELRELGILSIPLNIFTPIKNTPFAHLHPLSVGEVLTCVAMFRLINPVAVIRLAGGRNLLGSEQKRCFTAGANGVIVGNYLTTVGNTLSEDIAMFKALGFCSAEQTGISRGIYFADTADLPLRIPCSLPGRHIWRPNRQIYNTSTKQSEDR